MRNAIIRLCTCITILAIAVGCPALATPPATFVPAPPMDPLVNQTGGVAFRVAYENGTGIGNAYAALVNANDHSQGYFDAATNSLGYGQFTVVNNSWSSGGYQPIYQVYAKDGAGNEGYSSAFSVEMSSSAWAGVTITVPPAATPTPEPSPSPSPTPVPTAEPTAAPTTVVTLAPPVSQPPSVTPMAGTITPVPSAGQNATDVVPVPASSNLTTGNQTDATATPGQPTSTPVPTPGFEAALALAGLIGSTALYCRMKSRR